MDADDEQRLLDHITLCHKMIAQLTEIIVVLWDYVGDPNTTKEDQAAVLQHGERLQTLIAVIQRATDPNKEQ